MATKPQELIDAEEREQLDALQAEQEEVEYEFVPSEENAEHEDGDEFQFVPLEQDQKVLAKAKKSEQIRWGKNEVREYTPGDPTNSNPQSASRTSQLLSQQAELKAEAKESELENLIEQIVANEITEIDIPENFSYKDIEELLEVLQSNTSVETLNFNVNKALQEEILKPNGSTRFLASLKKLLKENETLTDIDLQGITWAEVPKSKRRNFRLFLKENDLIRVSEDEKKEDDDDDTEIVHLEDKVDSEESEDDDEADIIASTQAIIPVDLETDELCDHLEFLATKTTLTSLEINNSKAIRHAINTDRFGEILNLLNAVIKNNKGLTHLGLSGNDLHATARSLNFLKIGSLKTIDLSDNGFGKNASEFHDVVTVVNRFTNLQIIDLSNNGITTSFAIDLVTGLQEKGSSAMVNLSANPLTYDIAEIAVNGDKDLCACLTKAMITSPSHMSFILDDVYQSNVSDSKDFKLFTEVVNTSRDFRQGNYGIKDFNASLQLALKAQWKIIDEKLEFKEYKTRNTGVARAVEEIQQATNLNAFTNGLLNLKDALINMHNSPYYSLANATTYKKIVHKIDAAVNFVTIFLEDCKQAGYEVRISDVAFSLNKKQPLAARPADVDAVQETKYQRAEVKI